MARLNPLKSDVAESAGAWHPRRVNFSVRDIVLLSGMGIVPQKSELIDGEIYAMAAEGNDHSLAVQDLHDELGPA